MKIMFKRNKKYIVAIVLSAILFLGFSILFYRSPKEITVTSDQENYQEEIVESQKEIPLKINKEKETLKIEELEESKNSDFIGIPITLVVGEDKYEVSVKEGDSVFDSMQKIQKENVNFNFKYTEHPSLGNFVTEINGQKGTPGKYWIYYINDKKATIGVSKFILKSGDIIKWNQEGI